MRNTRWLLTLPALAFAFFPQSAQAEVLPGLIVTAFEIDGSYPIRDDETYPVCNIYVESNINQSWGGGSVGGCRADWVMLHYQGFIQIPEHESIEFMVAADDGGVVSIAGQEFGTWNEKGCSWSQSITLSVMPGEYELDGWFYEAGGGTCFMLAWKIDDGYWEIVPAWAYTTESTPSTTTSTTTVPETTVPATTTTSSTLQETSTTEASTTTEEPATSSPSTQPTPPTTTTLPPAEEQPQSPPTGTSTSTTTTSTSTTTSSTTSTTAHTTTTTTPEPEPAWVPQPTTTQEATTTTTTTTSEPPTETTVTTQPPQTTQPEPSTTIPQTPVTQTSLPATTLPTIPDTTTSSSTTLAIDTTTTVPPIQPDMSNQQILQQAINPSVVESLSTIEAEVLFASLDEESVTEDQAALIIQALDEAPDEVKQAFEENVNVFSGLWSSYKMVGQTISVAERVTLVAVANTMGAATAVLRRRN